ncbi:MAG: prephenate dehydratase [Bacteroidetes bacterium]|jgi:prephenate dehydratase|uniref:prephenate dehydratase n=1 Tax=Candidatus Cryptobacteroides avicola TaxID=2840757 RepID=A0A940DYW7_9BACT|nr:prephenate dehydratase [Candidatus Cryptobacteroides avicola]
MNEKKKVAIQGFAGCFHEQAARLFYGKGKELGIVECGTFDGLYESLEQKKADAAIMAIENTVSGGLLPNFELLRKHDRKIKGEIFLRICQNLMVMPGQTIRDIHEVRTHYMAINQTRQFFSNYPHIRLVESEDTAKSAADIAAGKIYGVGAVASALAADLYGLEIIAPGIETYKQNFTRFLVMDDGIEVPEDSIDKVSLCFTLPHKAGSLAQVLTILSFYDMNLTRIQSLPIPGREWQYFFYVDIKFDSYKRYVQALSAVRPLMEDLKVLGEYKSFNPSIS